MADRNEKPESDIEQRRYQRSSVVWQGSLEVGGQSFDCVVMNISANGVKLRLRDETDRDLLSGLLTIPRLGEFEADVVWRNDSSMGLKFDRHPDEIRLLLAEIMPESVSAS